MRNQSVVAEAQKTGPLKTGALPNPARVPVRPYPNL
jgi:hypothetical protein